MKPLLIRFWHGELKNTHISRKVEQICRKNNLDRNVYFDGGLSEWADKWQDKFLYYPATDQEREFIQGTIWITPYNSFGQR